MATDHQQSLRLGQRPVAPTPGVQLVAVASLPAVAYRGQIVYALDIDEFRVFDGDAWQIPTAHDTAGLQMFVGPTAPVADNIGDFWLKDTTYQIYVWDGTVWREVQDPTADAAAAAAAAANAQALAALGVANDAQATADGKVTTFYQSTEPATGVENPSQGDIWYRTSDNRAFIYHSGAFVEIQDQSIVSALTQAGTAQATADQKISSYYQTTAPWANGASGHGNDIGDLWFDTDDSNKCYRWDGNWTAVRDATIAVAQGAADAAAAAAAAAQGTANSALAAATTDGSPPSSSPVPVTQAGVGFFILKWTPITNADPVNYEIHVSATSGFTPGSGTLVGTTTASQFLVKALPGAEPAEGVADPRILDYDTTYYAKIIARDGDGAAAASAQTICTLSRVTGPDIAANSVSANNIITGTLTGDLFSANVIVSGVFKTADTGQRIEFGTGGMQAYKSDNSQMINLPTDGTKGLIDIEVIARGLTATDGASLSGASELNASSTLSLQQGTTAPSFTPQIGVTYDTLAISTASLTAAQKTGVLGTFDLIPSEVYCMEWKDAATDYWVLYQVRSNGTRAWFFQVSNGLPIAISSVYFIDYTNWEYYSVLDIASGTHAGTYRMGRWIPHGAANDFYLTSPQGINRYSRQNGNVAPVIGTDGSNIFVAEVVNTDDLRVRYFVPTGTGENLASPTSTTESTTGFSATNGICTIQVGNFDIGTGRYVVAHRGTNFNVQMLSVSGGAFYPGGSGNNWASANKDAESWESPTTNRRAMVWDAVNSVFWTFGGDGFMYKHTAERWDPAVSSSNYWGKTTYYDSAGTTHETNSGPVKNYTAKRRAKNFFTPPALTLGGADDPNNYRLYMARGATAPANASYHLQYTGTAATTWTTMETATATPPTTNNFLTATAAQIDNGAAGTLLIKADGDITGVDASFTTLAVSGTATKGGNAIAVEGPYYYAWLSSASNVASGSSGPLTGYTTLSSSGITLSTGNFTLPRTGRYRLYAQTYWGIQPTPVGRRVVQWVRSATVLASGTVAPSALTDVWVAAQVSITATAGDVVFAQYFHTAGGTSAPLTTGRDISFITIDWIGV